MEQVDRARTRYPVTPIAQRSFSPFVKGYPESNVVPSLISKIIGGCRCMTDATGLRSVVGLYSAVKAAGKASGRLEIR